jgi:hypothetical protein
MAKVSRSPLLRSNGFWLHENECLPWKQPERNDSGTTCEALEAKGMFGIAILTPPNSN